MEAEYISHRLHCTVSEKYAELETLEKLYRYARKARINGFLALEDDLENESDVFLKMGLQLVVDSFPPERVHRMMQASVLAGDWRGSLFLHAILIQNGVELIQEGESPRSLARELACWFGLEWRDRCLSVADRVDDQERGVQHEERPALAMPTADRSLLPEFDKLTSLDTMAAQRLIREAESAELALALLGAGNEVRRVLTQSLSSRQSGEIRDEMALLKNASQEDMREAQEHIVEILRRLAVHGELVFSEE